MLRKYHRRYRICQEHCRAAALVLDSGTVRFCQVGAGVAGAGGGRMGAMRAEQPSEVGAGVVGVAMRFCQVGAGVDLPVCFWQQLGAGAARQTTCGRPHALTTPSRLA